MPKLHLKRTPEEQVLHELRKKEKREGKRRRQHHASYHDLEPESSHSRKRRRDDQEPERKWASSDEDEEPQYGPQPVGSSDSYASRRHKPDQDQFRADMDDLRFREKLFDAFADDERLDSLEARMNDFAHVPDRWRSTRRPSNIFENDEWLQTDPNMMDEEEYTEWIRMGMYRKTHAKEYAEEQRRKAAQAARRAEEKARREETARLEKAAEEERKRKKGERSQRLWAQARETYQKEWQELSSATGAEMMVFCDIPWPIFRPAKDRSAVSVDDLTAEAISAFLLPRDEGAKRRKEVLRETFLRFHPDKFEGRVMRRVRESEQDAVRQGIGRVVVALNGLMAE